MRLTEQCSRHRLTPMAFTLIVLVIFSATSLASTFRNGKNVHIATGQVVENDLFASGDHVILDGTLDGDLFAGCYSVTTNGTLDGDLFAGCYSVTTNGEVSGSVYTGAYQMRHTGKIDRSIRVFSYECMIDGYVGGSALIFSANLTIGKGAIIERDARIGGSKITIEGTINGDANIEGDDIIITGYIGGDVVLRGKRIQIMPPAVIGGTLKYITAKQEDLEIQPGVTLIGEATWESAESESDEDEDDSAFTAAVITISKLLAAFLFGIILLRIFPRQSTRIARQLRIRFAASLATGIVTVLAVILTAIILFVSGIFVIAGYAMIQDGSTVAGALTLIVSMLAVPVSMFATICGTLMLFSGIVFFAGMLGYWPTKWIRSHAADTSKTQLLLGLCLLGMLAWIPYVGVLILVLANIVGGGAVVLGIKDHSRKTLTQNSPEIN